jgi:YHS domain-containing protein
VSVLTLFIINKNFQLILTFGLLKYLLPSKFRDRPFNLQGGLWFLFRTEKCFQTTRDSLQYFFSPEFNIRLYDKNPESDYLMLNSGEKKYCKMVGP